MPAHGQEDGDGWAPFQCPDATPLGTVYDDLARSAQITNTRVYGAVAVVEDHILPALEGEDAPMLLGRYDNRVIWDALRIPMALSGDCRTSFGDVPMDINANSLSLALRLGPVTVFYSGATTRVWGEMEPVMRGLYSTTLLTVINAGYTVVAPAIGPRTIQDGANILQVDYIAGMQADLDFARFRAGYIGSRGLYASGEVFNLFANGALTDQLRRLSFLKTGLSRLDFWPEEVGNTSIFARKLQFRYGPPPPVASPGDPVPESSETPMRDLWNGEVDQHDIGGLVDVEGNVNIRPGFSFRHFKARIHTPGINEPMMAAKWDEMPIHAQLVLGAYRAPAQHYYGVSGGTRFLATAEVEFTGAEDGDSNAVIGFQFQLNDPDTLELFPTAVNALEFYWTIEFFSF